MHYVYALRDPISDEVRYIGITENIKVRFRQHLNPSINGEHIRWISGLQAEGLIPSLKILEQCENEIDARAREKHWVEYYKDQGATLTNSQLNQESKSEDDKFLKQLQRVSDKEIAEFLQNLASGNAKEDRGMYNLIQGLARCLPFGH